MTSRRNTILVIKPWHVHYRPDESRLIIKDGTVAYGGLYGNHHHDHRQETIASYVISSWSKDPTHYYFTCTDGKTYKCPKGRGWVDRVFEERFVLIA
ncbi:MAG: hypothetical protein ACYCQJ_13875 [Nitrososphaerales archaeon]